MKVLSALLIVAAGVFFYPQINESSSSVCAAVEKRFARDAFTDATGADVFMAMLISGASDGALARSLVKAQSPNLPASLSCMTFYYRLMLDPSIAKQMMQ